MQKKRTPRTPLVLLVLAAGLLLATGCEINYRKAGLKTGELAGTAEAKAREHGPTVAVGAQEIGATVAVEVREHRPTVAAEVREHGPTVVANSREFGATVAVEVREHGPTVADEAATAAGEFSEGFKESGACARASAIQAGSGLLLAVIQRRPG